MNGTTLEQFGATIRYKYPEYASKSNKEVAQAVIQKYPQYASSITDLEQPEEKGLLRKVGDFFTGGTQKLGTTIGQLGASGDVIEGLSEAEQLASDTELKLRNQIREAKSAGRDTSRLERALSDLTGRQSVAQGIEEIVPAVNKTGRQVVGEAIITGIEATSGGLVSGVRGVGLRRLAPTAIDAATQRAQFLAKPLSGRVAEIAARRGRDLAQALPFGYSVDVANNLMEDKSGASVFKPGFGTLLSAAIPLSIGGVQVGRQVVSTALSKGIAPNLSGIPAGAYDRLRTGGATKLIGKVTPEQALDDARAGASAFKSAMQREFGQGQEQIITRFTGQRIGIPETTAGKLQKIAQRFGFEDRLPQNLQNISAKETMDLLGEINAIKPATDIDDPLVRSLKFNLGDIKTELMDLAKKQFSGAKEGEVGMFEKLYRDYAVKKGKLKDIQAVIGKVGLKPTSVKLTPVQHQTATRRLQKVFNDDAEGYFKAIQTLEDEIGQPLLDKIAASQFAKIAPKSFRVSVSSAPLVSGVKTGALGLLDDIISLVAFPLSSPRMSQWLVRKVGGYDKGIASKLLDASPSVRNAVYNAVHKENMAFSDAVELYAKDYIQNPKLGLSIEDVSKRSGGNLTTKFLSYIDDKLARNPNATLSRQEITDFARRPELKKGEADLLNAKVQEFTGDKLPAQDFADSIRRDLLELKPVKVKEPQYSNVSVASKEYRGGRVLRPKEFSGDVNGDYGYELNGVRSTNSYASESDARRALERAKKDFGAKNYEEVIFESPITTNGSSHFPNSKNYFAHARGDEVVEGGKKIWREQEIQSDLLQKDTLDSLFTNDTIALRKLGLEDEYGDLLSRAKTLNPKEKARADEIEKLYKNYKQEGYGKLSPFTNDRFGERIMRERIREKAQKGYSKYRLPTGETIGKIEGFEANRWFVPNTSKQITQDKLRVGLEIQGDYRNPARGDNWIITDILGDGRFKAVPKEVYTRKPKEVKDMADNFFGKWRAVNEYHDTLQEAKEAIRKNIESFSETFDLTGKSNPQYRRYEQWGKFLKNKYGGQVVTDPQGNSWVEIDLQKDMGRLPIEAFGVVPLITEEE